MILNSVSVDCVIFGFDGENLNVLLWQSDPDSMKDFYQNTEDWEQARDLFNNNPLNREENVWGLIGSHLPEKVSAEEHAKSIVSSFTGLDEIYLSQFKTFDRVDRVPFERVITIGYNALINPEFKSIKKMKLAKSVRWFNIKEIPEVIFDHKEIITEGLNSLREKVKYHPVGFHLLPEKFTLTQLQTLYEVILDTTLDTRNFRKKILNMKLLVDTGEKQQKVAHRAARLYEFDLNIYNQLVNEGLNFRI